MALASPPVRRPLRHEKQSTCRRRPENRPNEVLKNRALKLPLILNDTGIYLSSVFNIVEFGLGYLFSVMQPHQGSGFFIILLSEPVYLWLLITSAQRTPLTKENHVKLISKPILLAVLALIDSMLYGTVMLHSYGFMGLAVATGAVRFAVLAVLLSYIREPIQD